MPRYVVHRFRKEPAYSAEKPKGASQLHSSKTAWRSVQNLDLVKAATRISIMAFFGIGSGLITLGQSFLPRWPLGDMKARELMAHRLLARFSIREARAN